MHHRLTPYLIPLGLLAPTACDRDSPVEPRAGLDPEVTAASTRPAGALDIQDMLADPFFQSLIESITEPGIATPLREMMSALMAGELTQAAGLVGRVSAAVSAREARPGADLETAILWSMLERYFDAAGLR